MNKRLNKFSPEVRERAVRLVQEHRGEYPSLWAAILAQMPDAFSWLLPFDRFGDICFESPSTLQMASDFV